MDGLLVIDKPAGLTSHDVVARVRRLLRERSVGHTGTLDPAATGVLPLVLGRATRLARFLSAADKSYEAVVTLGFATETADAAGTRIGLPYAGSLPSRDDIERALVAFRGPFIQQPPAYSAKKIDGKRSYRLARAASAAAVAPPEDTLPAAARRPTAVPVVVHRLDLVDVAGDRVTLRVDCSAGFYVRSLAHDLGVAVGTGAHLSALRRIRSGEWTLASAIALDAAEREPDLAVRSVIPLARMLGRLPAVVLTPGGVDRARHGRDVGPADTGDTLHPLPPHVRLMDPAGNLVGIATPSVTAGLLHPSVVLV